MNKKIKASVLIAVIGALFCWPDCIINKTCIAGIPAIIMCGCEDESYIALTFDDGPYPEYTEKILNILDEYGIKATFFVVGKMVKLNSKEVKEISARGHEIGNHSYDDERIVNMMENDIINQIENTGEEIRNASETNALLFRPPGGRYDENVLRIVNSLGLTMVLWSINSNDYGCRSSKVIKYNVLKKVHNGAIVLMHNGIDATIEALPGIIEKLKERGYNFKTVSELIDIKQKKEHKLALSMAGTCPAIAGKAE